MIEKIYQLRRMRGAVEGYRNKAMSLDTLVSKLDGLQAVMEDQTLLRSCLHEQSWLLRLLNDKCG